MDLLVSVGSSTHPPGGVGCIADINKTCTLLAKRHTRYPNVQLRMCRAPATQLGSADDATPAGANMNITYSAFQARSGAPGGDGQTSTEPRAMAGRTRRGRTEDIHQLHYPRLRPGRHDAITASPRFSGNCVRRVWCHWRPERGSPIGPAAGRLFGCVRCMDARPQGAVRGLNAPAAISGQLRAVPWAVLLAKGSAAWEVVRC